MFLFTAYAFMILCAIAGLGYGCGMKMYCGAVVAHVEINVCPALTNVTVPRAIGIPTVSRVFVVIPPTVVRT